MTTISETERRILAGLTNDADSTGNGPDFPSSAGDRERGKFRRGPEARLTAVAVVDNDGNEIGSALFPSFDELIEEIRKLRFALMLQGTAADLDDL